MKKQCLWVSYCYSIRVSVPSLLLNYRQRSWCLLPYLMSMMGRKFHVRLKWPMVVVDSFQKCNWSWPERRFSSTSKWPFTLTKAWRNESSRTRRAESRQQCALSSLTKHTVVFLSISQFGTPGRVNLNWLVRRLLYSHLTPSTFPHLFSTPLYFRAPPILTHQPRDPLLSHLSMGGNVWC